MYAIASCDAMFKKKKCEGSTASHPTVRVKKSSHKRHSKKVGEGRDGI